jgi:hypothetical protein
MQSLISYNGMHQRIRRLRGRASEQSCTCGAQAQGWAYMHTDPDAVEGLTPRGRPVRFSLDPEHYQPRCHPCHARMDATHASGGRRLRSALAEANASKTACPSGHPYDNLNTRVRKKDGARICRACARRHGRARYRRLKSISQGVVFGGSA